MGPIPRAGRSERRGADIARAGLGSGRGAPATSATLDHRAEADRRETTRMRHARRLRSQRHPAARRLTAFGYTAP
jgi:hypothetical protein